MGRRLALGLDVGGTKLAAGLVDSDGTIIGSSRVPTPNLPTNTADQVWTALMGLVDEVIGAAGADRADLLGVGIGCGGPMRWPEGIVSPLNLPAWRDFPLRERVAEWLPDRTVRLHNDAICFAVAEHWCGAARGADAALGVVMSTGVGGGLLLGGRVVDGFTGNAGHIGHIFVELDGPRCGCGATGCLEAVARGPALVEWAQHQGWAAADGGANVSATTAVQLAEDARAGDPIAVAAFARAGTALARALASATNLLDLDVAVIGGGLSNTGSLLFDPLRRELDNRLTMTYARRLRVLPAELGSAAGVVGAAALVIGDTYWSRA
ncbi:MAG: ROK family protein [Mycobacteriales bacterium]